MMKPTVCFVVVTSLLLTACDKVFTKQGANLFPACPLVNEQYMQHRCGYIDRTGKIIIQPIFEQANNFSEGLAPVQAGQLWGYIDESGKFIITNQFSEVNEFSEGVAAAKPYVQNAIAVPAGLIDKTGKKVLDPKFVYISKFSEGLAPAVTTTFKQNEKFGYIDKQGNIIINGKYEFASPFSEGLALVCSDQNKITLCSYIDKKGNTVLAINSISTKYSVSGYSDFSEGLAAACVPNASKPDDPNAAKCGYIDKSGKFVIETKPAIGGRFSEDLAPIAFGDSGPRPNWGYIDKKGNVVIQPQFGEAYPFSQGIARVKIYDNSINVYHDAYINKKGEIIWDAIKNKVITPNNQQPNNQKPSNSLKEDND